MAPQLYLTIYKEQFASPGRAKREQLRPTSANRRNNPQPRPDFLFPRSLQPNYRSRLTRTPPTCPSTPVDTGRPLFPPVRHLSFHSPLATTCPDDHLLDTVDTCKLNLMPPVDTHMVPALPSADAPHKLQLHAALKNSARMDYLMKPQQLRERVGTRPQTSNPMAAQQSLLRTQYRSGCYSCFHVVKPYQAGHYIIHPEFVSESLR